MLRHQERVGRVAFALTDRSGGSSTGPFAALNLGGHVGDDPATVRANRAGLAEHIGVPPDRVVFVNQVHSAAVAVACGPWPDVPPEADGMVTTTAGLVLAVLVADCVPVLLADAEAGVVAVAHAGRMGLVAGVVAAVVATMREHGARSITARVGPSICGACYEVPASMRDEVAAAVPASYAVTRWGTPAVDVAAGVTHQLEAAGVRSSRLPGCTAEDQTLYSFRRDRTTGRFAGLVWLAE